MATKRASSGDIVDVRHFGEAIGEAKTRALIKTHEIEVLRLVVPRGRTIDTHQVPGDLTAHCLEGRAALTLADREIELKPGELVYLAGGTPHGVRGIEDTSLRVTISLHHKA